ncbi:restriction endonuclease subunit S [Rhizobium sp. YTUHZ045]|uniref:restriction endonuclease subunit S n=1 Tax=Rhizobium sp. YTUHZ045 TaxID=2962888 RepID=UPI003DA87A23
MSEGKHAQLGDLVSSPQSGVSVNSEDRPHRAGEIGVLKTSAVYAGQFRPGENKAVLPGERDRVRVPVVKGSIIISRMNTPEFVGASCYVDQNHDTLFLPDRLWRVLPKDGASTNMRWLSYVLLSDQFRRHVDTYATGTSGSMKNLSKANLLGFEFASPPQDHQSKIAEILDTLDEAIRGTEAVVAKLKAIKQGLLHDLLTRGIDANGDLRPPHTESPHLYKETLLGWRPKEWDVESLGDASESIIDGPFGSNLKTEHYVEEPGVRVVRLQNIQDGYFDDTEKAYIRESHAAKLARNEVVPGDVLIASLGDDGHPVGRSCRYPFEYPSAINKADCFRFRGKPCCRNGFVTLFLNGEIARRQARGYEQGVTMKRINLGNLRKIKIWLPKPAEQEAIEQRAEAANASHSEWLSELVKLRLQKSGLMDDLLTGRVAVTPLL